jgi:hypothetical protein
MKKKMVITRKYEGNMRDNRNILGEEKIWTLTWAQFVRETKYSQILFHK